jgi:hypothetical protein
LNFIIFVSFSLSSCFRCLIRWLTFWEVRVESLRCSH